MILRISVLFILLLLDLCVYPQDPARFRNEIKEIEEKYRAKAENTNVIVFTGSSSLRLWINLQEYFPEKNIVNTAFGGSQMSDLIYYADTVIFRYRPVQVFIYEGDNDIASGENPETIKKEAEFLLDRIHRELPGTEIVIISAKPSPIRWAFKDQYLELCRLYKKMSADRDYLKFIDLWTPFIGPSGRPMGELFLDDSLHINSEGYKILAAEIRKVIK